MLEVKNLTKVYSTKGGVTVRALDDVSVVFPEKGMVFLLGRSGSGKSTLLNVAGGLDKPDGGEVIVKGKSSKEFSGSDFDSYRNTFIGFVFQEYNILNEFTIEQNIALALQLQSKPNDKAAVAALLEQVDLAGYAKRKPNTLSGGQKQRVAIARALIKEPEIIMADEPTGALDSATGKQVLDTLKKLSEQKLVIVVSHDREFAEQYGDRIIELKDGKIISDVTKVYNAPKDILGGGETRKEETPNVAMISEDTIAIRKGEDLTDDDIKKIATLLRKKGGEAIITADAHDLPNVKRACKINENGDKESFKETVPPTPVAYDGSKTKFIKSKLPLGHAVKMGASGLKSKPIRLIFTIILAVAAFVLFGVVSTFMLYDPDYSISEGLKDAGYSSIKLNKTYVYLRTSMKVDNATGEETEEYSYENEVYTLFGASEVAEKNKNGLQFAGVFTYNQNPYQSTETGTVGILKDGNSLSPSVPDAVKEYYPKNELVGFTDCGKAYLEGIGFRISAGDYPTKPTEIMLSEYFADLFVQTEGNGILQKNDLVGKTVRLNGFGFNSKEFVVSGIVYTGEIPAKYDDLKTTGNPNDPARVALSGALGDYLSHGFETLIYVSADFYDAYSDHIRKDNYNTVSIPSKYVMKLRIENYYIYDDNFENYGNGYYTEKTLEKYGKLITFHDLKGKAIATPTIKEDEVYVNESRYNDMMRSYLYSHTFNPKLSAQAYAELGSSDELWNRINNAKTFSADSDLVKKIAKWYPALAYRSYLYESASSFQSKLNNRTERGTDAYDAFSAFNDPSYVGTASQSDLDLLQQFVNGRLQVYYGWLAQIEFNKSWTDEFVEDLGEEKGKEDPNTVINKLKNGEYTEEEFAARKVKLDAWFARVGRSTDVEDYFVLDDGKDHDTVFLYCLTKKEKEFKLLYQKISDYLGDSEKGNAEAVTEADWAALEAALKDEAQCYYGMLLEKALPEDGSKNDLIICDENVSSLAYNLRWNGYSAEAFATIKAALDDWFAENEVSTDLKDYFTFDISEAIKDPTLYYLDKNGNRGELTIVGYYEGSNASYFVKESFLSSHGEAQNDNNPYSYYDVATTNYVEPADAKYNAIISLSDNSMDQISVALQGKDAVAYHIDNAVAEELDEFLDMITELGEIFLYVGLGVGVLAAFFLLNFISVSIASKRKDIGILRAVGARGSDVFKIFYAEAFIIAFICFILASVGSYVLCFFLNRTISESIKVSLLNFGPINVALIFGISVFVSVIATFLPVYFAARKSPVDSIRAL